MTLEDIRIRPIEPTDDVELAALIRSVLEEFGAARPGTVYTDPSTDHLYGWYQRSRSRYLVAESDGHLLGGAGIYPLDGAASSVCELQKMYLKPMARGMGLGRRLIETCLDQARVEGYRSCYLETMPELEQALNVYAHLGFKYLDHPMGSTGHYACGLWMLREIQP